MSNDNGVLDCTVCGKELPVNEMYSVDACSEECQNKILEEQEGRRLKKLVDLNEAFALAIGWKRRGKQWVDPLGNRQLMPPPYIQHDALAWGGMARDKALSYMIDYSAVTKKHSVRVTIDHDSAAAFEHESLAVAICTAVAMLHGRWETDDTAKEVDDE